MIEGDCLCGYIAFNETIVCLPDDGRMNTELWWSNNWQEKKPIHSEEKRVPVPLHETHIPHFMKHIFPTSWNTYSSLHETHIPHFMKHIFPTSWNTYSSRTSLRFNATFSTISLWLSGGVLARNPPPIIVSKFSQHVYLSDAVWTKTDTYQQSYIICQINTYFPLMLEWMNTL